MVIYFGINGIKAYFAGGGDLMALRDIVYHRYAMVFIFAAILFIPLYSRKNSRTLRVAVVAIFIISIFVGLASMTRAIIIQIALSLATFIFLLKNKRRIVYYSVVVLLVVIALLPLVLDDLLAYIQTVSSDYQNTFAGYFVETVYDRIQALINAPHNLGNEGSDSERFLYWQHAMKLLFDNPLQFFMGFGELGTTYVGYEFTNLSGMEEAHYSSHSQIIDIVVRGGIIGLILYVILFLTIIRHGVKKAKVLRGFAGGLWKYFTIGFIGVLGYSVAHETLRFPYFSYFFWFILGAYSSPLLREDYRGSI
ncbi:MAG: O-antigen ligase family protein [Nitrospirae bacterium]|nr:O-antigen ligase family protein [Nitrospirota bacterium]